MFGFTFQDFHELDKGANGYKRMMLLHGSTLRVLFDGNENMGIHFDVSGSAIGDLVEYYKRGVSELTPWGTLAIDMDMRVVSHMLDRILKYGQVTRMDLAIDNVERIYFRVPELYDICKKGRCVSKFRSCSLKEERKFSEALSGCTVYMGSRTSSVFLRVYDKRLEQNSKRGADEELINYEWVRWELELKNERAQIAAEHILSGVGIGEVCVGILANYFRIIVLDNSNKSRCSTDIKWQLFIDDIQPLRLYIHHEEKSLDDKKNWILKQVAPTLTGIIIADHGDVSFLLDRMAIDTQAGRMKRGLRDLVAQANPDWEESLEKLRA